MKTTLYLFDIDMIGEYSPALLAAFESFAKSNEVAVLTTKPAANVPVSWFNCCKYLFGCDGNEFYESQRLRYKNVLVTTPELDAWIRACEVTGSVLAASITFVCDANTATTLVNSFNSLFSEFRALQTASGFCITDSVNARFYIGDLIDTRHHINLIASTASLTTTNVSLAKHLMLAVENETHLLQALPHLKHWNMG